MKDLVNVTTDKLYKEIMKQRESIVAAFIAETGMKPSECEQVVSSQEKGGGITWYVRVRRRDGNSD